MVKIKIIAQLYPNAITNGKSKEDLILSLPSQHYNLNVYSNKIRTAYSKSSPNNTIHYNVNVCSNRVYTWTTTLNFKINSYTVYIATKINQHWVL